MDPTQTLFLVHIMDGYSFRNTIGIIKSERSTATMVLSPNAIEISFVNTNGCAVHKIHINTAELTMYIYNVRDENGMLLPEYPVAFETAQFLTTIRSIGRRDGLRFYCIKGDGKINIQPIKTAIKDPGQTGASFVNIRNDEFTRYELPPAEFYSDEPNVRVIAKDFATFCTNANALKCTTINIIGGMHKVVLQSVHANSSIASVNTFCNQVNPSFNNINSSLNDEELDMLLENIRIQEGPPSTSSIKLNIVKKDEISCVKVPIATVKALSKIHNISPTGTQLHFYFSPGKPTKIKSQIGTYGTYTICIRGIRV